jgi:peptidoglycan/LPS O-acetylase OafA/YrhL
MSQALAIARSDHRKIDAVTGLRGLAALLVVYGHAVEWFSLPLISRFSGGIGVTVFFGLSGFLLAYLYLEKPFTALGVMQYVVHRFSRVAPAYLVIVLSSLLICATIDPQFVYAITGQNILRHLLFSGDVSVFWSITPEVEFYCLFLLLWAASSRYASRFDIGGLLLLAVGFLLLMAYRGAVPGTFIGSKLHYFLFGAVAGIVRSRAGVWRANTGSLNVLHGVLIAALSIGTALVLTGRGALVLPFADNQAFYNSLLTALFGALLIFSFSFPSAIGNFFFANKAILLCGECSFSIYLLHMPVIYLFHKYLEQPLSLPLLLPFIAAVLGLSWLCYRGIELPGARLIKTAGRGVGRKVAGTFPTLAYAHDRK